MNRIDEVKEKKNYFVLKNGSEMIVRRENRVEPYTTLGCIMEEMQLSCDGEIYKEIGKITAYRLIDNGLIYAKNDHLYYLDCYEKTLKDYGKLDNIIYFIDVNDDETQMIISGVVEYQMKQQDKQFGIYYDDIFEITCKTIVLDI